MQQNPCFSRKCMAWHGDGWYSLVVLTKRMDVTKVLTLIVPSNKATSLEETLCFEKTMRCFGILHQCLLVLSAVAWGVWSRKNKVFFLQSLGVVAVARLLWCMNIFMPTDSLTMINHLSSPGMTLQVPSQCHPGKFKPLWRNYQLINLPKKMAWGEGAVPCWEVLKWRR